MRYLIALQLTLFIYYSAFSQTVKLPPKDTYYIISNQSCAFPKQTGKLKVIRNDSLKLTTYQTDSSAMIMYGSHFIGFLTGWDKKDEALKIYSELDTLITQLFTNGLLTSDLLINAYNHEEKAIDYKGDTLDFTRNVHAKTVKILNIQQKKLPRSYRDKKGTMLFEVWVTFDLYESGWGGFPMFDLYLKADINPNSQNFKEYLKRATIKCLRYTASQI